MPRALLTGIALLVSPSVWAMSTALPEPQPRLSYGLTFPAANASVIEDDERRLLRVEWRAGLSRAEETRAVDEPAAALRPHGGVGRRYRPRRAGPAQLAAAGRTACCPTSTDRRPPLVLGTDRSGRPARRALASASGRTDHHFPGKANRALPTTGRHDDAGTTEDDPPRYSGVLAHRQRHAGAESQPGQHGGAGRRSGLAARLWPSAEARDYLEKLLADNREGTRNGFPQSVAEEMLLLIAVIEARN